MKVSIIIANRNDLQMLLVTVLSAVEALESIGRDGEIVIVDNSDEKFKDCIIQLMSGQRKDGMVQLHWQDEISESLAMENAARLAKGEYLFYTDSHTMIGHGTLVALLRFFRRHEGEPIGFVHAPIQWAHNSRGARKTSFRLHRNVLGGWGHMAKVECKIPWKGMPHMIKKEIYHKIGGYGCMAEHRAGWGGLIPYLGIKSWVMGYENWAIPYGVTYHFGEYPQLCREYIKYRLYGRHGKTPAGVGHAVALYVFGDEQLLRDQFKAVKLDRYFKDADDALKWAKQIGEEEREFIQKNQKISFRELLEDPPWSI